MPTRPGTARFRPGRTPAKISCRRKCSGGRRAPGAATSGQVRRISPVKTPTGAATVLGKAVLGIAGAYLLRALAESGAIPKLPVLIAAIVYASLWIVWAVRTHATSRFASVTYGVTSALILAPLLWESTVRFQVLPPIFAAVELVAFAVLALALAWPRNLEVIPSVATVVTIITALALMIATHDLVCPTDCDRCVDLGEASGTVVRISGEELNSLPGRSSVHPLGVSDLLLALRGLAQRQPAVVRLGVQPGNTDWSTEWSPPVAAMMDTLVEWAIRAL